LSYSRAGQGDEATALPAGGATPPRRDGIRQPGRMVPANREAAHARPSTGQERDAGRWTSAMSAATMTPAPPRMAPVSPICFQMSERRAVLRCSRADCSEDPLLLV